MPRVLFRKKLSVDKIPFDFRESSVTGGRGGVDTERVGTRVTELLSKQLTYLLTGRIDSSWALRTPVSSF